MTPEELYKIAHFVAIKTFVHGLDYEDKLQECVEKGLQILQEPNNHVLSLEKFIKKAMRNKLIKINNGQYNNSRMIFSGFDETYYLPKPLYVTIPIPIYGKCVTIVKAMISCEGNLTKACKLLDINYQTGVYWWKIAKQKIKEDYVETDKEVAWLRMEAK